MSTEAMAALRQILLGPLTGDTWDAFCRVLQTIPYEDPGHHYCYDYLDDHLRSWAPFSLRWSKESPVALGDLVAAPASWHKRKIATCGWLTIGFEDLTLFRTLDDREGLEWRETGLWIEPFGELQFDRGTPSFCLVKGELEAEESKYYGHGGIFRGELRVRRRWPIEP